ncbi:MAG: hypothetical protein WCO12_02705 [bacterium]
MIKKIIATFRKNSSSKKEIEKIRKSTEGVTAFEQDAEEQVVRVPTSTPIDEEANGED